MVYVPILKIDLPEPRLQELIPGAVNAILGTCTLAFDAVYDLLHPLPPEGQEALYEAVVTNLPREFRKARHRIVDLDIRDEDKISEELETAAFNFYRCKGDPTVWEGGLQGSVCWQFECGLSAS